MAGAGDRALMVPGLDESTFWRHEPNMKCAVNFALACGGLLSLVGCVRACGIAISSTATSLATSAGAFLIAALVSFTLST